MRVFQKKIEPLLSTILPFKQPIDRAAIALMLVLSVTIGLLLLTGDRTAPRVREFTWQNRQIGAEDTGFILTFFRPMNHSTVEANLKLDPPLPGKFSWAGRRMAYTLKDPAPYGVNYTLTLSGATDKYFGENDRNRGRLIQPFNGTFRSRDRAFAYIGVRGEAESRLMLVNLTSSEPTPIALTPKDLVVTDFKPYPDGSRILFTATDRSLARTNGTLNQELFTITTGITNQSPTAEPQPPQPAGKIDKLLDSKDYQNLKFDLSADGKIIVIQRVNRRNPGDFSPWILEEKSPPRKLENQQGGDFIIRPDSRSMVISQKQGLAIVPLKPDADPVEFLPKYEQVLSLARDNSTAAYVKYNTDFTRSLFIADNQGLEQEILRIPGSIISVYFDPRKNEDNQFQRLYCLLAQRLKTEDYKEQPFIAAIDLKKDGTRLVGTIKPLLILPEQLDTQISLSPDGLALIFDQSVTAAKPSAGDTPRNDSGQSIATSRLWLLPLVEMPADNSQAKPQPEELPFAGYHPRWLP
ncbi:MAG: Ig-like domain-containing protein [Microcoleus sp. SU_5_6]|nr:Ig-like domain-containing protein [Microcoleus sp. SU_5_6]NJL67107.1 Ig-like domain-containing protein [Microcoleus sp. SM1_3_4]